MIALYRDVTHISQPYQMLILDVDAYLTKWRCRFYIYKEFLYKTLYNHLTMVQRMVGNKLGTGGSSGYQQ